jgi:hypothetical protein
MTRFQWRTKGAKGGCAINVGALRKKLKAFGCAFSYFPSARQRRIGADLSRRPEV